MKKLYIYTALVAGWFAGVLSAAPVMAQSGKDKIIFGAMNDELQRNKAGLTLADAGTPFFISYVYASSRSFQITGSLGALIDSYEKPWSSIGSVQVLLGDYHRTSASRYDGQFTKMGMPIDANYDAIRRSFWLASDYAYKNTLQEFAWKKANQKANPLTEEEEKMDDLSKIQPIEKIVEGGIYEFDRKQWEENIRELSGVFKDYKELFNSIVGISGIEMDIYKETTEQGRFKQPVDYVRIFAQATVMTEDGVRISDNYSVMARSPQELPSVEKLKADIKKFAENLSKLSKSDCITEYYSGPVLFENSAAMQVFSDNLLSPEGLFAFRKPEGGRSPKTLEDRMGRKIIDNRITIKNYSALDKYNSTPLLGAYEIDAEGVVPPKEITLVENGILKQMLNGRVPAKKTLQSTGSSRFMVTDQDIVFATAPGTIHVQVKDGLKQEKMKKALLKAAKEEGLDYAYIIRRVAGKASQVYKVDVKDGAETLMRTGDFGVNLRQLKRLLAISAKEDVANFMSGQNTLASIIYPSSVLVEDVEISKSELKTEKKPALQFPLQREKK